MSPTDLSELSLVLLIMTDLTGKLDVRGVDLGELPKFDEIPETDDAVDPDGDNDHLDGEFDDDIANRRG